MNCWYQLTRKSSRLLSWLVGGIIFTSCASAPQTNSIVAQQRSGNAPLSAEAPADVSNKSKFATTQAVQPRSRPQLIKKATMTIIVDSVSQSIDIISQIISKQQGDLIGLEERQPQDEYSRHTAAVQMRIPQNLLEPTLDELAKLGTVENRTIAAEDVGDQIVDIQARLNNLRKTESNLQKIMDRAGSVRDVLSVTKELSNTRDSIERIDAQLKNLQNQVAYSTIALNLEAAVSSSVPQRAFGSQVQETWINSTHSLGEFSVGLLKLSIWLIVYSPYLLILAAAGYGFIRWRQNLPRSTRRANSVDSD